MYRQGIVPTKGTDLLGGAMAIFIGAITRGLLHICLLQALQDLIMAAFAVIIVKVDQRYFLPLI
jgi:hypothetical protein